MRRGVKILLVALLGICLLSSLYAHATAAPAGLTVAPGALTLTLATDAAEQSTEFSLTNTYQTAITLRFAFEPRADTTPSSAFGDITNAFSISRTELSLKPNESITQKVTLRDQNLSPGSHLADLIITQHGGTTAGVGIEPSIRVPMTILKQNGAVNELKLAHISVPRISFSLPKAVTATLHNSGNVIAIPRGVVTVGRFGGTRTSQGVLNTGSTAISPGAKLTITTPLANVRSNPILPGIYTTTVQYGLGGDQPATSVSGTFVYIAGWHVLVLLALLLGGLYLLKRRKDTPTSKLNKKGRAI